MCKKGRIGFEPSLIQGSAHQLRAGRHCALQARHVDNAWDVISSAADVVLSAAGTAVNVCGCEAV